MRRLDGADGRIARRARGRRRRRQAGAAPLHAEGHERRGREAGLVQGQGHPAQLLGDVVRPCKAEIPSLVELQEQYGDDLVVLGFSVDDTAEKMKPYAEEYKINYPLLVGNGREDVQEAFGPLFGHPGVGHHRPRRQDREEALGHRHQGAVRAGDQAAACCSMIRTC